MQEEITGSPSPTVVGTPWAAGSPLTRRQDKRGKIYPAANEVSDPAGASGADPVSPFWLRQKGLSATLSSTLEQSMKRCFFLFAVLFGSFFGADAKIFSTSDLRQVEEAIGEGEGLVLLDVDGTLIVPEDAILRPAADALLDQLLGGDKIQMLPTGNRYIFREILLKASHRLVDPQSIPLIQNLQERGIPVVAFTALPRGKVGDVESVADYRLEELARFGFDFSPAFAHLGTLELPKDADKEFSPFFKQGVLFSSLHSKGDVFKSFLRASGYRPKWVILIDDQMKYVQSVEKAAKELGIEYVGIHYTAADELPCILDPDLGAFQVRHFLRNGEWKSDEEAHQLKEKLL